MTRIMRPVLLAALAALLPALAGCPKSDDPIVYIAKLQKDNEETRRRAVEELVRMHKKAMPYVTGRDVPPEVEAAVKAASYLPAISAKPDLDGSESEKRAEKARTAAKNVRIGAAEFLAKVRRMESIEAAGDMIHDEDQAVRLKAIEALAKLSQVWKNKSVELLDQAFMDADAECVKKAGEGLRDMAYLEATQVLRKYRDAGEGIQAVYAAKLLFETEKNPALTSPILLGISSPDKKIRTAAELNVTELKDAIIAPLVDYIDVGEGGSLAEETLDTARDALVEELDVILDSRRAADILMALGTIADQESVQKLKDDLEDDKLEKPWRVAAARGMARAAMSPRSLLPLRASVKTDLTAVMEDEDQDQRIQIGAAIALCEMKEKSAGDFLLKELDGFEEDIQDEKISETKLNNLTELRIGAQEALTGAGKFVVPMLLEMLGNDDDPPGPIIIWAATKTLGELRRREIVTDCGRYLTDQIDPAVTMDPGGDVTEINGGRPIEAGTPEDLEALQTKFGVIFEEVVKGEALSPADMKDWEDLAEADAQKVAELMEVFEQPDYVRWTAAIALGRIGGDRPRKLLLEAEEAEEAFLARLAAARERKDYYKRAAVVDHLARRHEEVLFYIRKAINELEEQA